MTNWKIGLDPGHGGKDTANVGPTGYVEAQGALDIGLKCRDVLLAQGYQVVMTRDCDKTLSIAERAQVFNQVGVDLALSIHSNAADSANVRGTETIYSIAGGKGKKLAEMVLQWLCQDLALTKRSAYSRESTLRPGYDYYGIIRQTKMPCIIVEVEFHTNPTAEALLKTSGFRQKAGQAIAEGIMEFCTTQATVS